MNLNLENLHPLWFVNDIALVSGTDNELDILIQKINTLKN